MTDPTTRPRTPYGDRAVNALRTLANLRAVLLVIVSFGSVALTWNIVTDEDPATAATVFERIDAYVDDELRDAGIPGASIAIVEDGAVVHAAGFGTDGNGNPATADTPFWIGSNTKSITALAIMQLVEAGAVELDAPVQTYLPDFAIADPDAAATITIRHLLNQTSGISRIDGLLAVTNTHPGDTVDEVVAAMAGIDLNRPVGGSFEYANLNSVVLGLVIETVSGRSWPDYVQANILDPLEMTRTYTDKAAAEANGLTAAHRYLFGFPRQHDAPHLEGLAPTGYVYSTANDMARYLAMYTQGGTLNGARLLTSDATGEMLAPATDQRTFRLQSQSFTAAYGAGWFIGPFGAATEARWHQGSLPQFTAWMIQLPDSNQALVVLLNAGNQFEIGGANASWSRIPQGVVNLLLGEDPPTGPSSARFFIVFNTLAAAAVVALTWHLVRTIRRPHPARSLRALLPLASEIGLAAAALAAYPVLTGGLGWRAAFTFLPDLSLTVVVICGLALASGIARIARLALTSRTPAPASAVRPPSKPQQTAFVGALTG